MTLEIGIEDSIELKVQEKDLAKNLCISADDNFPEVLATARMIALMEASAAKVLTPLLEEGQLSVGVEVNVKHLAPTLCGDIAKSTAKFEGMEGKLYKFSIEVEDSAGKIGFGTHTRAIITEERLMTGAQKRVEAK